MFDFSPSFITLYLKLSDLLECLVRRSLRMSKKELLLMLLTLVKAVELTTKAYWRIFVMSGVPTSVESYYEKVLNCLI